MGKKVISFSLYGNLTQYTIGSINNAKLALELYKGWECWFYVDITTVPTNIISELLKLSNVRIIYKDINYLNIPMYWKTWRFEPIDDNDVDVMISRDTDTLMYRREVAAVDEWLKSDMSLHILKDSPCHRYYSIQGGMFGLRKNKNKIILPNITYNAYKYFTRNDNPGLSDLSFLEDFLYPILKNDSYVHDEFTPMFDHIDNGRYYKPFNHTYNKFPIRYNPNYNFMGEYVYEDGSRDIETCNILLNVLKNNPHMIQKYKDIEYCLLFSFDINIDSKRYLNLYNFYKQYNINTLLVLFSDFIPDDLIEYKQIIILINDRNKDFFNLSIILLPLLIRINNNTINGGVISHDINLFDLDDINLNDNNFINYLKQNSNEDLILYNNEFCFSDSNNDLNKLIYFGDINYIKSKLDINDNMTLFNLYNKYKDPYSQDSIQKILDTLNNTIYPVIYVKSLKKNSIDLCGIVDMYIIHYTKLVDRKIHMTNQIKNLGLDKLFNIIWVDNYDRENIPIHLKNEYYKYDSNNRDLTPGEIANGIAHMSVINSVYSKNKISLIVEDDIVFRNDFIDRLKDLNTSINKWDILTLGGWFFTQNSKIDNELNNIDNIELFVPTIKTTTVSFYILTPNAAKKILNNKKYKPFSSPIDDHMSYILYDMDNLDIMWVKPWLGVEGSKVGNYFTTSFKERGF